jgi:hypothetical protein
MSSALEQYETSLVRASRELCERCGAAAQVRPGDAGERPASTGPRAARAARVPRARARAPRPGRGRRGRRLLAGALTVGALAAAGTTLLGPTGNPRNITQFVCGPGAHASAHVLVTPDPLAACAALWPSIYHRPAPALVAWVYETGGAVVVRPAGDPPGESSAKGWVRLPRGWRADSATIELNDQLEDITTGLPAQPCWTAASASELVASLLRRDRLGSWHIRVSRQRSSRGASGACLSVIQAIGGPEDPPDTVLLVEHAVPAPANGTHRYPNRFGRRRRIVERRVNRMLRGEGRCANLRRAAVLWRTQAAAGGIPAGQYRFDAPVDGFATRTGSCARIFVSEPGGGGPSDVYPADLP